MTEKNANKKNSVRHYYKFFGIVVFITIIFTFFQIQINSKIRDHPKIVTMEANQKNIDETLKEIKEQLKELNRKMNKLLIEEHYP